MNARIFIVSVLMLIAPGLDARTWADQEALARKVLPFDSDWLFFKGDVPGAEASAFDDANWRRLDVPHDWSIEGPYDQNALTGRGGGYLPAGVGWYRKHFTLLESDADKRIFIEFDGVMANSEVWINGQSLGDRPYGYVSFRYDLTGQATFGADHPNTLAVRCDNSLQPASRWYAGAGIYRHARLVIVDPIHIDTWGSFVTTPQVNDGQAVVQVRTRIVNQSDLPREIVLNTTLLDPNGAPVGFATDSRTALAGESFEILRDIAVVNPQRWRLDHPKLYRAESRMMADATPNDDTTVVFGIRQFEFRADTGFWLNGVNLKIKGVGLHHDGGGVGTAVPLGIWRRRLEGLRALGVNAVRTSTNPPASEFLDLCDRMGFLVMDETFDAWTVGKTNANYGYQLYFNDWWEADTRNIAMRDRNHPSVILWCIGNEIRDNLDSQAGLDRMLMQRDLVHQIDLTRPVTMALFRPNQSNVYTNGFADLLDVIGQNYRESELVQAHVDRPERKVIGTETNHTLSAWLAMRDNAFFAGQFLWTGIDYLGEADWPRIGWSSALMDRTGRVRPLGYQRQSWWAAAPMVNIARYEPVSVEYVTNWTPRDAATYPTASVQVYTNCEQVELLINGRSLGVQPRSAQDAPLLWNFPYEAGEIQAVGRNGGTVAATHAMRTAGAPTRIEVTADQTILTLDWDEVSVVTARIVDAQGEVCPWAEPLVAFDLAGPGRIVAVDNGSPTSHEPYQANERTPYLGQCIAIVKATDAPGQFTVSATAAGLTGDSVHIDSMPAPVGPAAAKQWAAYGRGDR